MTTSVLTFDDGAADPDFTVVPVASIGGAVASVFGRTGTVVAAAGDYFGSMPAALTGATQAARFVGATTSGAPASGTFAVGDVVVARDGKVWVCTVLGSPGTWVDVGGGASVSYATPSIVLGSSAAAGAASTVIRSDSTIAAFDATSPTTQAFGDSAVVGTAAFAARRDHKHAMPAAPAAAAGVDGWVSSAVSLTYSSVDGATGIATTGSSLVGVVPLGARIKFDQTTTKYFIVTAVDATTLTFWGGTDYTLVNAAITNFSYSTSKVPAGFNADPTKWTVETNQAADAAKASPVNGTWYGDTGLSATGPNIVVPIGAWRVYYQVYESASAATAITCTSQVSLSTSTTAVTDADLTSVLLGGVTTTARQTLFREKLLVLAAKATYYLICRTTVASQTTIGHAGGTVPTIIRAVCAYL